MQVPPPNENNMGFRNIEIDEKILIMATVFDIAMTDFS
jgi:hypothetical protein